MDSLVGERDGAFQQPVSVSAMMELILGAATRLFVERQISLPNVDNEDRSAQKEVLDVFDESIRDVVSRVSDGESGMTLVMDCARPIVRSTSSINSRTA